MSRKPLFSVEVFGDAEALNPSIDAAVTALEELQQVVGPIEVIARNGLLRLSPKNNETAQDNQHELNLDHVAAVNFDADFGLVLTDRCFVEYKEPKIMADDLRTVGIAYPRGISKPFAIVDTATAPSIRNTSKHEILHLLNLYHCTCPDCLMFAVSSAGRGEDPCDDCGEQVGRNIFDYSGNRAPA